jgi:hypothetical protein
VVNWVLEITKTKFNEIRRKILHRVIKQLPQKSFDNFSGRLSTSWSNTNQNEFNQGLRKAGRCVPKKNRSE